MKKLILAVFFFSCLVSFGQGGSEIFLFDLKVTDGQVFLSGGINISNHKGYDNQPFFHPSEPVIYYSSANDSGRTDLRSFDYIQNLTTDFVITIDEREYSPTVTPDGEWVSCIIQRANGDQDLGMYPVLKDKRPVFLIRDMKIGYHAWADKENLLLFVLADSNTNVLHYYNLSTKTDRVIATNPGRSLHKIPGDNAMSFIQKNSGKDWLIQKFDLSSGIITTITHTLPGQENLTWLKNSIILMSDGDKLFSYRAGVNKDWQPVIIEGDITMLKGITRLAINTDNSKLAMVVSE